MESSRIEAEAQAASVVDRERDNAEEQASRMRSEFASELKTWQDKARGVMIKMKEQHEERAGMLTAEVGEVRDEAASAHRRLVDEQKAAEAGVAEAAQARTVLEESLSHTLVELSAAQANACRFEKESESAHTECRDLLAAGEPDRCELERLRDEVRELSEVRAMITDAQQASVQEHRADTEAQAVGRERHSAEERAPEALSEVATQHDTWREEIATLQDQHEARLALRGTEMAEHRLEAEAVLASAVERERNNAEEQASQAQAEFAAQREGWRQEVSTLQEKARGMMGRVKEQLRESRAEADTANQRLSETQRQADTMKLETVEARRALKEGMSQMQVQLSLAQDTSRCAERDLEAARTECRELSAYGGPDLQQQVERMQMENVVLHRKATDLAAKLATMTSEYADLQAVVAQRNQDCRNLQGDLDASRAAVPTLEARIASLEQELDASHELVRLVREWQGAEAVSIHERALGEVAAVEARAVAAETELRCLQEQQEQQTAELASVREGCDQELDGLRSACRAELSRLREAHAEEARQLHEDVRTWRSSAENNKEMNRVLRERLATQEEQAALQLENLRNELAEVPPQKQQAPLLPMLDVAFNFSMEDGSGDSRGSGTKSGADASVVELDEVDLQDEKGEGASAWRAKVAALEERCQSLQRQLDRRPVIYNSSFSSGGGTGDTDEWWESSTSLGWAGSNARRRASWEPWLRPVARRMHLSQGWEQKLGDVLHALWQLIVGSVDDGLRSFTKRLLKNDKFMWVFYAHLLLLYMIAAASLASTAVADDPLVGGTVSMHESAPVASQKPLP